jgi:hypothetical protein
MGASRFNEISKFDTKDARPWLRQGDHFNTPGAVPLR